LCISVVSFNTTVFSAEQYDKKPENKENTLAVLDIESSSRLDNDSAALLTDNIWRATVKMGRYSVTDWKHADAILRKHSLKINCGARECAVEAGQLLNVKTVVAGSLNKVGKTYFLSLSRINVKTQTVEFIVEEKIPIDRGELLLAGDKMVNKLLGNEIVLLRQSPAPDNERFVLHNLSAFDKQTGLVWLKDTNKSGKAMTWDEASDYIRQLNKEGYAGFDDWRLPDKEDFSALIAYAKSRGVKRNLNELLDKMGFKNTKADYYWTATPSEDIAGLAWVMDMYGGELSTANKSNNSYVWPVRTEKRSLQE